MMNEKEHREKFTSIFYTSLNKSLKQESLIIQAATLEENSVPCSSVNKV